MRRCTGLLLLGALPVLSGCAAAVIPVVAGGVIAKKKVDQERAQKPAPQPEPVAKAAPSAAIVAAPAPSLPAGQAEPAPAIALGPVTPLTGLYARFAGYALEAAGKQAQGTLASSTVLVDRFALERPEFHACDTKPAAVILDLDDSASGDASGANPVPGLANALERLRAANIVIFWLTDAGPGDATAVRVRLQDSGLDPQGADAVLTRSDATDRKHVRRQDIARTHCVLASAGDSKADVEEAYAFLRQPEAAFIIDKMWDAGWFLLPAPLTQATDAKDK